MPVSVVRRIPFCAGHRLLGHEGKCAGLHGHNYIAEVEVVTEEMDSVGRVIDFAELKSRLKGWIDEYWDHGFLLNRDDEAAIEAVRSVEPTKVFLFPGNPTAENMADYLFREVCPKVLGPFPVQVEKITLWETPDCCAVAK
ncbi:6-pyruvoyl trahydropterin synthase family protein [Calycomorphotria hydatis]|uniref:6-carboxy-5,6,7,8-tetrahydropterin synthase n=1 Tax=Calycomorphotria hydatis TaxID=2528027 RepID=A0A517T922_9PLAN|nr:6-carboxytetrahydropterin synthase [Calycomorphotria hydatis]QDT64882.1 6-carboxy-5,6,7,8-tetrahydropterin synthase [Calycomorphotria hydatis]